MANDENASAAPPPAAPPRPALLMLGPHGWFDVWQRPHHLAARFARRADVAFIAPRWLRQAIARPGAWRRHRGTETHEGVRLEAPLLINGERRSGWLRRRNQQAVARAVAEARNRFAGRPLILWLYDPHQVHMLDAIQPDLVVYDIMDDFAKFPWAPPGVKEEEDRLLERADLVFTGTWALYDSRRARARRIECEISGVEADAFAPPPGWSDDPESRRAARSGRPWAGAKSAAGYAGTLDGRIDSAALAQAARALPDWAIVLVGPRRQSFPELDRLPNVHFPGQRPYAELPALYRGWDAGLIPFARNEWTDALNPTKTLEYFAAGLPVAASEIPDLKRLYSSEIAFYHGAPDLSSTLRRAVESDSTAARARRLELARERSWDAIAQRMWTAVTQSLKR